MTQVSAGVRQRVVHPPDPKGVPHVPNSHALPTGPPLSAIERPRQTRTMPTALRPAQRVTNSALSSAPGVIVSSEPWWSATP